MNTSDSQNTMSVWIIRLVDAIALCPKIILFFSICLMLALSYFLLDLEIDTSTEAFIPKDHSSVVYRQKVKELFGLKDPVVMVVVNEGSHGVFDPKTLNLISELTEKVSLVSDVNPDRVKSISTEKNIFGSDFGMEVELFYEAPVNNQRQADSIQKALMNSPIFLGTLVAKDGTAALIAAETTKDFGTAIYDAFNQIAANVSLDRQTKIYVAGEGAFSEYFGRYVFIDSMVMISLVYIVVAIILFFTYKTVRGVVLPMLVVMAACAISIGLMTFLEVPYYIITNALPVLLVAIGVADGIHILGEYYEQAAKHPEVNQYELVVKTMTEMWRPVTVTSITDIAGFLALGISSYMPPLKAFGYFASLGVGVAWLFSMIVIPAGLLLLKPQQSSAFKNISSKDATVEVDRLGRFMGYMGIVVTKRPVWALILVVGIVLLGSFGAARLKIDENRMENIQNDEPIYRANTLINQKLDGTAYLDIVIETDQQEGLFVPDTLQKIEALQDYLLTMPHVTSATSIVDFIKLMNRAINTDKPEFYRIPDNAETVAQYFLLYSATSSPNDFEEYVDYDYRLANIRVVMDSGWYSDFVPVIDKAQSFINQNLNEPGLKATLAGRVNVDYHWINNMSKSHFRGVIWAFIAVLTMVSISLRSCIAGVLALIPVTLGILIIYAWMGITGLNLSVATSMFAAISLGCAVDFAVHTLDRLISLVKHDKKTIEQAFATLFPSTGRALLFNFIAIFIGFSVLLTSQVPSIIQFGTIVCVSVTVSFIASIIVLPPLIKLIKPKFLEN